MQYALQYKVNGEAFMRDLNEALADIRNIRSQLAAGTLFRGLAPVMVAVTGVLALGTAVLQSLWPEELAPDALAMLEGWVVTAFVAGGLLGVAMILRSRRYHGGMSGRMTLHMVERFLPAGIAGAALALFITELVPEAMWMLPGLWQVVIALGIFAAMGCLPRAIALAGVWYFAAGMAVLAIASVDRSLSPWMMGIPFAVGQFLVACILHFAAEKNEVDDDR
jgi:hypothetical protein